MQFIGYIFFLLAVGLFKLIPFRVVYGISDFFAFLLLRVFKYRKDVILKNLHWAFPEFDESAINDLLPDIYRNFTDIVVESIKASSTSLENINKRYKVIASQEFEEQNQKAENIVVFASHYGNWEWGTMTLQMQTPYQVIGLIKPLANKFIHRFIEKSRSKAGTGLVSIYESKKAITAEYDLPTSIVYIADQNPSNKEKAHSITFFEKDAKALHGGAEFAYEHPERSAWYYAIERVKRGYYEVHPVKLIDNSHDIKDPSEITQLYFNAVEAQIKNRPSDWVWTHKRWKGQIKY